MKWFLFKMLFSKTGFKKTLKKLSKEQIIEYRQKVIVEENYELAAYLEYYIEFKKFKVECV